MANVFDYLDWRGDLGFRADPFNVVDNIIFSMFSYYPFDGIVNDTLDAGAVSLPEAAKRLIELIKKDPSIEREFVLGHRQADFLTRLAETPRYRDCTLRGYVNKIDICREMQFAVITILTPETPPYISFRGTDSAIIGWKEDFNMILNYPIPAQVEAVNYLNDAAKYLEEEIYIGGHSKGGNLAVYASAFCNEPIQKHIKTIYSNDAPGFSKQIITSDQYKAIEAKIDCYIPESSVVGLLFEYVKNYKVVKSSESGIMQHDPFSWEIQGKNMVHINSVSKHSIVVNKMLMKWLEDMNHQTRLTFVETLYDIVNDANIKSVHDFTDNKLKNAALLIKSLHTVDNESKKMLFKTFSALFDVAKNNIQSFIDVGESRAGADEKPRQIS
ncbi:MAG: DUF2974 domain-containing protein [Spirochaetaceae bacterium]|jgi:hypothetical protein|nr:DUF2974 domain-containing protein [Spirochaetaceae bacterium]